MTGDEEQQMVARSTNVTGCEPGTPSCKSSIWREGGFSERSCEAAAIVESDITLAEMGKRVRREVAKIL